MYRVSYLKVQNWDFQKVIDYFYERYLQMERTEPYGGSMILNFSQLELLDDHILHVQIIDT